MLIYILCYRLQTQLARTEAKAARGNKSSKAANPKAARETELYMAEMRRENDRVQLLSLSLSLALSLSLSLVFVYIVLLYMLNNV